jgi:hypothetical protein
MRFISALAAQILQWALVVGLFTGFANSQDASNASRSIHHIYSTQQSSGQVIADTLVGIRLTGATTLASKSALRWALVGVADFNRDGTQGLVYFESSTGALAVIFHGGKDGKTVVGSNSLATPGPGWTARAVADLNGDGHPDVIFVNNTTGQADVYFYGGSQGTSFLSSSTVGPLSLTGWNLVGTADVNGDGRPDLILQNASTRQVLVDFLGGAKGTTVIGTQELGANGFTGWTAQGMQDLNDDGHPDLILLNDVTGQAAVSYFGGTRGLTYLGTQSLDTSGAPGWKLVIPSGTSTASAPSDDDNGTVKIADGGAAEIGGEQAMVAQNAQAATILIFNGTGTSTNDVTALENVVKNAGLAYQTVNSSQLDAMTQAKLATYKLFIVPGGNSITIGNNLSSTATTNVRNAVAQNGLNYLGVCAGGFFGGFSKYNGVDLTSGVWFSLYADYYKGIHKEPVSISFPSQGKLDIYWQDGPDLSGWGSVVGRFPNGHPAIVEGKWGKGFVLLSGVHAEAPASWRTGMNFYTPLDVDLAYAATLLTSALSGISLPHY